MSTFYGGEQLVEIKQQSVALSGATGQINQVLYTAPVGVIAYLGLYAYEPNFPSVGLAYVLKHRLGGGAEDYTLIDGVAGIGFDLADRANHPSSGKMFMLRAGDSVLQTYNAIGFTTNFVLQIYEYQIP